MRVSCETGPGGGREGVGDMIGSGERLVSAIDGVGRGVASDGTVWLLIGLVREGRALPMSTIRSPSLEDEVFLWLLNGGNSGLQSLAESDLVAVDACLSVNSLPPERVRVLPRSKDVSMLLAAGF